ncbi:hypothetical protein [Piscinibacter defluvii]|uniref:hypothetical protein n=1 Tax=Piscinibacter defluvii TaxID=1796922 RepID=UPI000FDEEA01|nr:hypothetical protein [Piscinibacter defluvii]
MSGKEACIMGDGVWMLVAGLGLACAVLVVLLLRRKRPAEAAPEAAEPPVAPAEPVAARSAETPKPAAATPPGLAGGSTPALPPRVPVATTPSAVVAAPATRPPRSVVPPAPVVARAPRFVLRDALPIGPVMLLERADPAAWALATPVEPTPMQRDALGALLVQAGRLEAPAGAEAGPAHYLVRLRGGTALPLARGELAGAPGGDLQCEPPDAIDPTQAAGVAAIMLALHCGPAYLSGLRARVSETKSLAAALHPKLLAQGEGRLKALLQDLTRYLREAEENYAGAIRKPVFIARVGETTAQAEQAWHQALQALAAPRAQIEAQLGATRFGEVQLERSLAALRELQGQHRLLDVAARVLAGWHQLRLALGEAASGAAATLRAARESLEAGAALDHALLQRLDQGIEAAKAPDYVGKAEFLANRTAARELLGKLDDSALLAGSAFVDQVHEAVEAGFAGRAPLTLLLQLDEQGRVAEVRTASAP